MATDVNRTGTSPDRASRLDRADQNRTGPDQVRINRRVGSSSVPPLMSA
jgi:hypothetical protein